MVSAYDGISIKNRRATNMDSILLKERVIAGQKFFLAVVCDGVGSMEEGAFASAMAVNMLSEWFDELTEINSIGFHMKEKISCIDKWIVAVARARGIQTASTLSALLVDKTQYYIVHSGDSRIYSFRNGIPIQLTEDQTHQGKLTGCLGWEKRVALFYCEARYRGEKFLLCSDGLYKKMDMEVLQKVLYHVDPENIRSAIENLIHHVLEYGEEDNVSVAILV